MNAVVTTWGVYLLLFRMLAAQRPAQPGEISIPEATANSIKITWTASAGPKDSYTIIISPAHGSNPTGRVNDGDPLEYTFTGLTAGTEYSISVSAVSGGMTGVARTATQGTTVAQPGAITIVPANVTENSIRITWTAAAGAKDSYNVNISPAHGNNPTGRVNDTDPLEYTFTGLTAGTLYNISVVTVSGGVSSVARRETQRTPVGQPGAISIAPADVTENSIKVTWTAAAGAVDSYNISISPDTGVTNPTASVNGTDPLEYTFTGLTPETSYNITVTTVSSGDSSVPRTREQRTSVSQPGNITIASSDVTQKSIRVSWTAAAGPVDSYSISISPDTGVTNPNGSVNPGDPLEYSFTNLTAGTLYSISVTAVSGGMYSRARTEQQRTIVAQPGDISIASSDVTENSIRITWTAAAGTKDSYNVNISPDGSVNDGDTLEYSFTGLTAGTLYSISVVTVSGGDSSVARVQEQRTDEATDSTASTTESLQLSTRSPDGSNDVRPASSGLAPAVWAGIAIAATVVGVIVGVLLTLLVQHLRGNKETKTYKDVGKWPGRTLSAAGEGEYEIRPWKPSHHAPGA